MVTDGRTIEVEINSAFLIYGVCSGFTFLNKRQISSAIRCTLGRSLGFAKPKSAMADGEVKGL